MNEPHEIIETGSLPSSGLAPINSLSRLPNNFWQTLEKTPYRYDLFQLLRRIDAQGGQPYLLGCAPRPRDDLLRLGQEPSLSFAPSTLAQVNPRAGSSLYEVSIFSFGLFGPNGPLPLHMTEYVYERLHHHQDRTLLAFSNLFHHRLITLFYRAWANAQPTVSLDRPDNRRFDEYLSCLMGIGLPAQRARDSLSMHAKHFMAGHLVRHGRDPEGLGKILQDYFNVPVRIIENVPHWIRIEKREQARLGAGRGVPRLGESAFLGIAMRDIQHKFCIELGPMSQQDYDRFLPGAVFSERLRDWVRQYVGIEFVWEVRLILAKDRLDGIQLGGTQQLGLSSWMENPHRQDDVNDLTYSPEPLETPF
ncbi:MULTISPECIES: type VI secretion system baseplate subunit TssG [unclassified Serratia (in: enterobacteria)]|uniref:type VI secretion system baseplate subunit TssG n=1 Tax=unclassified Serratia (in: enterobacteria) TaxID=2647522 RepID=UPI00069153A9|nr:MULTISPECIES: type VI secretion system baseplate subunit TssG [unclassified Serratia (in: enterobacteria)]